jgi:hypothetical protein
MPAATRTTRGWPSSSMALLVLVVLCCALAGSVSTVYATRARIQTPHLLHVSVSPLALRSFRANTTSPTGSETDETLVLLRFFFDRSLRVNTPTSLQNAAEMFSLTCSGSVLPLSSWLDGSQPDRPQLVTPPSEWMEFFTDEENEEEAEEDSSTPSLALPSGHIGSGGSPFASNSFVTLLALPAEMQVGELERCEVELKVQSIMQQAKKQQGKDAKGSNKPILLSIPLSPKSAVDASSQSKKYVRQRDYSTVWSPAVRTTRWIVPPPPAVVSDGSFSELNSTASCASLREEQRLIFLENGATSVGAIVGPVVSTMMQPVISQFEQTSTVQTAQSIAKNYVSAVTGAIPPEVANFVSLSLSTGVTEIVVDLLTTSITDSCSSSIAAALGAYLTRSVSEDVGEIVNQHLLGALTQMIPPDLSQRLTISVTKKLPQQIIKDVSMSLTQTLVGSLTRGMSNFNHMQKMCRSCALFKTRCSDCKYVKDVAVSMTHYSGQYSHYYAGYYSEFYAPPASQLDIKGMADKLIPDGPAEGTRGVGEDLFGEGGGGGGEEGGGEGRR